MSLGISRTLALFALALGLLPIGGGAAQAANCSFTYSGENRPGDYAVDWTPICDMVNGGLGDATIELQAMTMRWRGRNLAKGRFCGTYAYTVKPPEPGAKPGPAHVVYLGAGQHKGACKGYVNTPRRPKSPTEARAMNNRDANIAADKTLKGQGWNGDGITQIIVTANYRPKAYPGSVWPIVMRLTRGHGGGPGWQIRSYEYVCVDKLKNPNIPPGCPGSTSLIKAEAEAETMVPVAFGLDRTVRAMSRPRISPASGLSGWTAYEVLNPPKQNAQRLDEVVYRYDDGSGTVMDLIWQEYCDGNGLYVTAAKDYFLTVLTAPNNNIFNCSVTATGGQCVQ
ncbi:MAG: hypothetical protein KDC18_00905 [Alphaproteobacteria bacterium]|nr:hypothetical protein [Alphaproteobacteria bacterium]MCB9931498.1 hypothetical protein [Alphaproteobacteria bacterium]